MSGGGRASEPATATRRRPRPDTTARLLGLTVVVLGLASLGSAVSPIWRTRLVAVEDIITPGDAELAAGTAAVIGLGLLLVGRGVIQRRRGAARTAIVLLATGTAMHLTQHDVEQAAACAALAAMIAHHRGVFVSVSEPNRARRIIRLTATLVAIDFTAGLVAIALQRGQVEPRPTPRLAVHEVAARLVGSSGPFVVHGRAAWFAAALTVLGMITLASPVLAALAPVPVRGGADHEERERVRGLVARPDADTLDPFALRRDKRYVFSLDGKAAIAYRYLNGAGLAAGDPIGRPASFGGAVSAYLALCERHGWRPAVYGASEAVASLYRAAGLRSFYIGDEAIIDVDGFTLDGRAMRGVRQAVARTRRAGVTVEVYREGELSQSLRLALFDVAADQRGHAPERGFAMTLGGLFDGSQPDCLVFVARDAGDVPIAFHRYAVCGDGHALSLDVMRRAPHSPNGVNERVIVEAIAWARAHRARGISLNFAAFRALLEEDADLESFQTVEAWFVRRLEGRFGIQMDALRRFNAKFRPRWVPRHLVYRTPGDLPAIGVAALSAEAFLPFDRFREPAPAS